MRGPRQDKKAHQHEIIRQALARNYGTLKYQELEDLFRKLTGKRARGTLYNRLKEMRDDIVSNKMAGTTYVTDTVFAAKIKPGSHELKVFIGKKGDDIHDAMQFLFDVDRQLPLYNRAALMVGTITWLSCELNGLQIDATRWSDEFRREFDPLISYCGHTLREALLFTDRKCRDNLALSREVSRLFDESQHNATLLIFDSVGHKFPKKRRPKDSAGAAQGP